MTRMDDEPTELPQGFEPIFRTSPLLDVLGGFHSRGAGTSLEIGLVVGERHLNSRGRLHGGVVATLADTGLGYLLAFGFEPPRRLVTVSLAVDYVSSAELGAWLRVRADTADTTGRLVFATGRITEGERVVARIKALFSAVER